MGPTPMPPIGGDDFGSPGPPVGPMTPQQRALQAATPQQRAMLQAAMLQRLQAYANGGQPAQPPMPVPDINQGQPIQGGGGSAGGAGASGGIGSDARFPLAPPPPVPPPAAYGQGGGAMPWAGNAPLPMPQQQGMPAPQQTPPTVTPPIRPVASRNVTVNPRARAQVPPGTGPGSPFTWTGRPNATPGGGALGRGGPANMTMLDLSRFFGNAPNPS